tara:strand:+ start:1223 stop:1753 length:531 start_codon:yes stop_codon:yes gene_type:complete
MRYLYILLFFFISNIYSQEIWQIDQNSSQIKYSGSHFLHNWSAENNNIAGVIKINDSSIENIGVVAKVSEFESGNSNLDSNSYRVLEALRFPNIIFKSVIINNQENTPSIEGVLNFHGIEKNIFVDLTFNHKENSVQIEGMFAVKLSDFQIKRPSLMLQKVDDEILVELNLIFVKG